MKARFFGLSASIFLLAACSARESDADKRNTASTPDCTAIASAVERLACFDTVAGTPVHLPAAAASSASSTDAMIRSPMLDLVQRNETPRRAGDHHFLLSRAQEEGSYGTQIVISAPALGNTASPPVLAISCLSGISRIQLIVGQPIANNRVRMRLLMDGKPIGDAGVWQTLDGGTIVDAGRGLVAIDLLKRMGSGERLRLESNYSPTDGLLFDASGLHELIAEQREACHW
ncbi:type VI secretion system-associated protein VasI [Dyella kyungheensis]|uniref:Type VI secretion system-associated protein TagO n=1 Tax=Dyella kyungheensis TaxID=1242174 RepID=A0ABS2JXX0_9GAMM|nr:type VI secretion system-associated protein VasI [Dyella kyungheensis]MBM7123327.1 type VI secretion system-associated protein TagO [Dyella kyungheensis]